MANARILILTPQRAVVATATSDQDGKFTVPNLADADYLVIAQHPPFAERQMAVKVSGASPVSIDIILDIVTTAESVSVTATPGNLTDLAKASQPVNVISAEDVTIRAKTVVAQAVEGEVGVAPAANESRHGRHLRARAHRQQGECVRRRRPLFERRPARRRQHVPRSHRSIRRSTGSKCCVGPRARSTEATRSEAAFSSSPTCRRSRPVRPGASAAR